MARWKLENPTEEEANEYLDAHARPDEDGDESTSIPDFNLPDDFDTENFQ